MRKLIGKIKRISSRGKRQTEYIQIQNGKYFYETDHENEERGPFKTYSDLLEDLLSSRGKHDRHNHL